MSITTKDIDHLCHLAKLAPENSIKEKISFQLSDIMNYMDTLSEVDTTNILPLYSPCLHETAVREDSIYITQTPDKILANAPETDGEYFIVPRIVEGK